MLITTTTLSSSISCDDSTQCPHHPNHCLNCVVMSPSMATPTPSSPQHHPNCVVWFLAWLPATPSHPHYCPNFLKTSNGMTSTNMLKIPTTIWIVFYCLLLWLPYMNHHHNTQRVPIIKSWVFSCSSALWLLKIKTVWQFLITFPISVTVTISSLSWLYSCTDDKEINFSNNPYLCFCMLGTYPFH